jgi:Holliday junction resolvase RusA-like endonuclease
MKIWRAVIIAVLLLAIPMISSCDVLGIGGKSQKEKYYEQQIQLMQQQQEAAAKAQQEYYDTLQKALQDYMNQYAQYNDAQRQAEIQAIQQAAAQQAKEEIPYN